jgi:hypothetical protein
MRSFLSCLVVLPLVLGTGLLHAQQPNSPSGTMTLNGIDGPPYPLVSVGLQRGTTATLQILGLPNARFVVVGSSNLASPSLFFNGQFVDVVLNGLWIVMNGYQFPSLYTIGGNGTWSVGIPIGQNLPLNSSAAYQGACENPAAPGGHTYTAASRCIIIPGLVTIPVPAGDDTTHNISLTAYNLTIPFYAATYSNFWVNSNGSVSFVNGDMDFTPTPPEMLGGPPRIAGAWCDLNPGAGGTVNVVIDQSLPFPTVQARWNNVAEFGVGPPHTFYITMTSAPIGDLQIIHTAQSPASLFEMMCGIAPGSNLGTAPQKNLNGMTAGLIGAPNENFHEWFGLTTMFYYTAGFNNPWDLVGTTLTFYGFGVGAPGASYMGFSFP